MKRRFEKSNEKPRNSFNTVLFPLEIKIKTACRMVSKSVEESAGVGGRACATALLIGITIIVAWLVMEQPGVKFFAL